MILRLFVVGILVVEMLGIGFLERVWGEEAAAVSLTSPDGRAVGGEQAVELGVEAVRVGGEVEQCIALLG